MAALGIALVVLGAVVLIPGGVTPGASSARFVRGAPGHLFDSGPRRAPAARRRVLQVVIGLLLIAAGVLAIAQIKTGT
jgi:uncharacterized membrane protein HdeD (DUF308 family)